MAVHAQTAAGVIGVIVMAGNTIFTHVVDVGEVHRQDLLHAAVLKIPYRFVFRNRRAERDNKHAEQDQYAERELHAGIFLTAANKTAEITLTAMYAEVPAIGSWPSFIQYARPKAVAMASSTNSAPWYQAPR